MKIYFFTRYPPAAGEDSFSSYCLARELGRAGHNIYVINFCREKERMMIPQEDLPFLEPQNVELFSLSPGEHQERESGLMGYTDRMVNIALSVLERHDADLIMASDFFPSGTAGLYTKLLIRKPLIISDRSTRFLKLLENPFISRLVRETLRKSDRIEVREKDMMHFRGMKVPESKLSILETSVDPDYYTPDAEAFDFSPYSDIDFKGRPLFTFLDRLEPDRKIGLLIEAASALDEGSLLCILTGSAHVPYLQEIKNLVNDRGLMDRVIFLPPIPPWKFSSLMKSSTAIVYAGIAEEQGLPGKFIHLRFFYEALLCKKCVILSGSLFERSRFTEMADGKQLLIFDSKDPGGLGAVMKSLVADPERAEKIGILARRFALSENRHKEILGRKIEMFSGICENFSGKMKNRLR
jgi:glycosyltransferase involved in cell wall biosynthesis